MTVAFGISLLIACGDSDDGGPRADGVCGDGELNQTIEVCDDGNTSDGDSCSADCTQELCVVPDFDVRTKLEGCAGDPMLGGCHAGASRPTAMELDLTNPATTVEAALSPLIDQVGSSGALLIDSADVRQSFLLQKLSSEPGFGSRMPLTRDEWWSNEEAQCLRLHIQDAFGL